VEATRYRLDGTGIESLGAILCMPVQTSHEIHPAPLQWVPGLSRR